MNEQMVNYQPEKLAFSQIINAPSWMAYISDHLNRDSNRVARFVASITSAVSANPALRDCTPESVISGALLGESLGLPPSPQLGQFYLVPYNNKKTKRVEAQFQIGYKGLIQLAWRSGQYRDLDAFPVVEGEYRGRGRGRRPILEFIENDAEREGKKTVGYYAFFELNSGVFKELYWSKEQMIAHADRYSPAFSKNATNGRYPKVSYADYERGNFPPDDAWKYSSFWYKDFDGMACKTMLRQLISKWGPINTEMQKVYENTVQESEPDMAGTVDFPASGAGELPPQSDAVTRGDHAAPVRTDAPPMQMGLDDL